MLTVFLWMQHNTLETGMWRVWKALISSYVILFQTMLQKVTVGIEKEKTGAVGVPAQLRMSRVASVCTLEPWLTRIWATVPARGEEISFSIFMASRTTRT